MWGSDVSNHLHPYGDCLQHFKQLDFLSDEDRDLDPRTNGWQRSSTGPRPTEETSPDTERRIDHDPLGTRGDFRAAASMVYLDTPATAPLPRQVEEAGNGFLRTQGDGPISLPAIFQRTSEVRAKFASLFGASEREVGFMYTTGRGRERPHRRPRPQARRQRRRRRPPLHDRLRPLPQPREDEGHRAARRALG